MRKVVLLFLAMIVGYTARCMAEEVQYIRKIVIDGNKIYVLALEDRSYLYTIDRFDSSTSRRNVGGAEDFAVCDGKIFCLWRGELLEVIDGDTEEDFHLDLYEVRGEVEEPPHIVEGSAHTLWLSMGNRLGHYKHKTKVYFISHNLFGQSDGSEHIKDLAADKDGKVWIAANTATGRWSYACYSKKDGMVDLAKSASEYSPEVWSVRVADSGDVWFVSESGLVHYDLTGTLTRHDMPGQYTGEKKGLFPLPDGDVLCSAGDTLLRWHDGTYEELCQLTDTITYIVTDDNSIYLGTTCGLFKYDNGEVTPVVMAK